MRYGIPGYRLAREVLDAEIDRIVALGVQVHCNAPLAAGELERLRATHDAVYLATGAAQPKALPQLPAAPWLLQGSDYLAALAEGAVPRVGARVLVVGGGSAAMDVARSARRAGCEVTSVSLEPREHMPAQHEDVLEAAVVGHEDDERLVKPKAFVVLKAGQTPGPALEADIKQFVKDKIAPYKYPRWIEFVGELPKTATGKIQRFKLRQ